MVPKYDGCFSFGRIKTTAIVVEGTGVIDSF